METLEPPRRSLRLCFVGPANNVTTRRWVEWFSQRGHVTTIITVEPMFQDFPKSFQQVNVGVSWRFKKLGRLVSVCRMVWALHQLKPDIVHVHYVRGLAWGLLLSRMHPCVVTPWGSDILEEQGAFRNVLSKTLTCWMLKMADLITVNSQYMRERVEQLMATARSVVHIGWGVNLRRFSSGLSVARLRERWNITPAHQVIFSPRLAKPFYNHDRVIRAFSQIHALLPQVLLVIPEQFADPVYVRRLRALTQELGVEGHVRFLEEIPYEDMPAWYNLADVVVMVPDSDGMPNSLWEAMACGAVPVLRKLPQYTEVIQHGVNGFLVDVQGHELEETLRRVLTDAGLRERVTQMNFRKVKESGDQDQEMGRMERWYEQLVLN